MDSKAADAGYVSQEATRLASDPWDMSEFTNAEGEALHV